MDSIGVVILAAGASTRLGRPKQLLCHRGETLIARAARAAGEAGCSPAVVVVGEEPERIEHELRGLSVHLCHHAQWQRGIGSSIRAGVDCALSLEPDLAALLLMVCDQPFVTAGILKALMAAHEQTRETAAACAYSGTIGVPALFDRSHFGLLAALPDEQGAKSILARISGRIALVEFPPGAIDIDTAAEWRDYLERPAESEVLSLNSSQREGELPY